MADPVIRISISSEGVKRGADDIRAQLRQIAVEAEKTQKLLSFSTGGSAGAGGISEVARQAQAQATSARAVEQAEIRRASALSVASERTKNLNAAISSLAASQEQATVLTSRATDEFQKFSNAITSARPGTLAFVQAQNQLREGLGQVRRDVISTATTTGDVTKRLFGLNQIGLLELQAAGINSFQALAAGISPLRVAMTEGAQVLGAFIQGGILTFSRVIAALTSPIGIAIAAISALTAGFFALRAATDDSIDATTALKNLQDDKKITDDTSKTVVIALTAANKDFAKSLRDIRDAVEEVRRAEGALDQSRLTKTAVKSIEGLKTSIGLDVPVDELAAADQAQVKRNEQIDKILQNIKENGSSVESVIKGINESLSLVGDQRGIFDKLIGKDPAAAANEAKKGLLEIANALIATDNAAKGLEEDKETKRLEAAFDGVLKKALPLVDEARQLAEDNKVLNLGFKEGKISADQLAQAKVNLRDSTTSAKDAIAALIKVQEEADAVALEARQIDSDRVNDGQKALVDIQKQTEQIKFETGLIGLNNSEREKAIVLRKLEDDERLKAVTNKDQLDQFNKDLSNALDNKVIAEKAQKAAEESRTAFKKASEQINQSLTDALLRGFEKGKDFAQNFVDTLRNAFGTLILQPIVRFILEPVGGSVLAGLASLGIPGFAAAAGGSTAGGAGSIGGLGEFGSILDIGSILNRTLGGAFGSGLTGSAFQRAGSLLGSQFIADIGNFGFGDPIISTLINLATGNIKGAAGSAVLGTAGALVGGPIGGLLGSIGGTLLGGLFGSNKIPTRSLGGLSQTFDGLGGVVGQSTNFAGATQFATDQVQGLFNAFQTLADKLGATFDQVSFSFGANTGKQSKNPQFRLGSSAGGFSFDTGALTATGETPLNDENLQLAASRAVLTALQGSQLPNAISVFIKGLVPSNLTQDAISKALDFAVGFKNILDSLDKAPEPVTQAAQALAQLDTQLASLQDQAVAFGSTVDTAAIRTAAIQKLVGGFNEEIQKQILQITDPLQAQLDAFDETARQRIKEAQDLGADLIAVERLNALQRQQIIDQAQKQQTDSLKSFFDQVAFGSLSGVSQSASLEGARAAFEAAVSQGADSSRIVDLGRSFLDASKLANASSTAFFADRARVLDVTGSLIQQADPNNQVVQTLEALGISESRAAADQLSLTAETNALLTQLIERIAKLERQLAA